MRDLFGDIVSLGSILVVIRASEKLAKDRVVWFLDALGFDMPSCEDQGRNMEKSLFRVFNLSGSKDQFRMCSKVRYTFCKDEG